MVISITASSAKRGVGIDSIKNLLGSGLKKQPKPDTVSINRLNKLAAGYFDSNPDSTFYYARKSIELATEIGYQAGIANGLVQTGHVNFFKAKFDNATQDFNKAILIYKKLNYKTGLSNIYTLFGRMYYLLANYKLALDYLNLALSINKQLKNEAALADCLKNIGNVYYGEGQLSMALDYYFKALDINTRLKNQQAIASNYNNIGLILEVLEVYPQSFDYYTKALTIFKAVNNLHGIDIVYQNLSEILIAQKNYDLAINYLLKGVKIAEMQDDKEAISADYNDLGLCYAHKGQINRAINYLNTSLQIASSNKTLNNKALALIGFATAYNLQKKYARAYKYALLAQQLAVELGNINLRANAAIQLNETLAGLNDYEGAYKMLLQYNALKDSLHNNESIQKFTSFKVTANFTIRKRQAELLQHEKDESYKRSIEQQRFIITIFSILILAMITVSLVYYRQKRKQQKVNAMLEEKNLKVLEQKADLDEQAQKLNELNTLKDRLISVLAHDLRAPLSTLRGLFSLLQDETISHSQMLEMIPGVLKKLEYTSDFLDTLLFWINSQMENFESSAKNFRIKDTVSLESEAYREQAASKGIKLIENVPGDLVVSADPNSIRIVIRNLITNAIKFSKENDIIDISAAGYDENYQIIHISDTGTGINDEQLKKLFKTKVNSKAGTRDETGTGMGLLFCKDLIEKCNGKIWVTSKPGEGTKFSFIIPVGVMDENLVDLIKQ